MTNAELVIRRSWRRAAAFLALIAALLPAGCARHVVPVLLPVSTTRVKPGAPNQALVILPKGAVASVYLHFLYVSGRVTIRNIGVVDHTPGKVDLLYSKTRAYVDDGDPLQIIDMTDFNSRESRVDFHILKDLPEGAKGKWLRAKRRFVMQKSIRGPTVVLFYRVEGHVGFVKIRYRPIWDMPG
ncbi:MAG: hypothetical protein ABIF82_12670 [Planctomycetota bacterium]